MSTKKPVTQYSISAVSRITGKSRSTIQRDLKAHKLTFVKGPNGAKLIDASEVARAYPDACDFSREEQAPINGDRGEATRERDELQRRVDTLEEERRRERDQLQAQIDHLQSALRLAQEGHVGVTRLLEDRSSHNIENVVRNLEERITIQQERINESFAELRSETKRETIVELKELPWWSALWRLASA